MVAAWEYLFVGVVRDVSAVAATEYGSTMAAAWEYLFVGVVRDVSAVAATAYVSTMVAAWEYLFVGVVRDVSAVAATEYYWREASLSTRLIQYLCMRTLFSYLGIASAKVTSPLSLFRYDLWWEGWKVRLPVCKVDDEREGSITVLVVVVGSRTPTIQNRIQSYPNLKVGQAEVLFLRCFD